MALNGDPRDKGRSKEEACWVREFCSLQSNFNNREDPNLVLDAAEKGLEVDVAWIRQEPRKVSAEPLVLKEFC